MRGPRVVFAILDAFPHAQVSPELTPVVWALAQEGGRARDGGRGVLSASTYPNHATFVTGALPDVHHVITSRALVNGALRPAAEVGPAARTLFDDCRDADRRAVGIFGDQNLVGVCGALAADAHWPPKGVLPAGAPRGRLGYGADRAVVAAVDEVGIADADLVVLQLDETDTARHLHGPSARESLAQCRATDAALGEILERVRARWAETVVIVVSDHDNEAVEPGAIDLHAAAIHAGLDVHVEHDGTACVVLGDVTREELRVLPGVVGAQPVGERRWAVWGPPGVQYGIDFGLVGQHGSPRTLQQLAVVGGGHPDVRRIASRLAGPPPSGAAWAPLIRGLLELRAAPQRSA